MNSRSSANDKNLVNFSADLSSLNQLEPKDSLLSFPFDHIYACHSDSSERSHTDKELDIDTCVVTDNKEIVVSTGSEIKKLSSQLSFYKNQNKKLKDLLIYHLDLIQQQNEQITKREKLYQSAKQENDSLKSKLSRMDRRVTLNQRPNSCQRSFVRVPTSSSTSNTLVAPTITSTVVSPQTEPITSSSIILNSFTELLLPENKTNSYIIEADISQGRGDDSFELTQTTVSDDTGFMSGNALSTVAVPRILNNNVNCENYTMIENRRSDAVYTVTSTSGNSVIQRIERNRRRTASGIGSLSRMPKSSSTGENSKVINTYGRSRSRRTTQLTGSLSDRLQLIDTTPTGGDPYQLGEDDMREHSPIPKLMLQKPNHMRVKHENDKLATTLIPGDNIEIINTFPANQDLSNQSKLKLIHNVRDMDWCINNATTAAKDRSLSEYSFNENDNLSNMVEDEMRRIFGMEPGKTVDRFSREYNVAEDDSSKRRNVRTSSLVGANVMHESNDSRRGRKRAFSTTGLLKPKRENAQKPAGHKPKILKGKVPCRGKKSPLPGLTTSEPYHTTVGEISWHFDPDYKRDCLTEPTGEASESSLVEVPRWREKPYTSIYTMEGTENLDDKIFEKRHQKLEAEERRQLRWHMRRVREQRHVERLRQRQRDSWCGSDAPSAPPPVFTVWPQPQRDLRFIVITDTLPVTAFGEIIPALPESDFILPWVRTSKALKRSKRSKTLH